MGHTSHDMRKTMGHGAQPPCARTMGHGAQPPWAKPWVMGHSRHVSNSLESSQGKTAIPPSAKAKTKEARVMDHGARVMVMEPIKSAFIWCSFGFPLIVQWFSNECKEFPDYADMFWRVLRLMCGVIWKQSDIHQTTMTTNQKQRKTIIYELPMFWPMLTLSRRRFSKLYVSSYSFYWFVLAKREGRGLSLAPHSLPSPHQTHLGPVRLLLLLLILLLWMAGWIRWWPGHGAWWSLCRLLQPLLPLLPGHLPWKTLH